MELASLSTWSNVFILFFLEVMLAASTLCDEVLDVSVVFVVIKDVIHCVDQAVELVVLVVVFRRQLH
jgi:hypothetical protein